MKNLFIIIIISILVAACATKENQTQEKETSTSIILESNQDPICKMDVQTKRTDTILYQGKIYGFCSPVCKEEFLEKIKNNN